MSANRALISEVVNPILKQSKQMDEPGEQILGSSERLLPYEYHSLVDGSCEAARANPGLTEPRGVKPIQTKQSKPLEKPEGRSSKEHSFGWLLFLLLIALAIATAPS